MFSSGSLTHVRSARSDSAASEISSTWNSTQYAVSSLACVNTNDYATAVDHKPSARQAWNPVVYDVVRLDSSPHRVSATDAEAHEYQSPDYIELVEETTSLAVTVQEWDSAQYSIGPVTPRSVLHLEPAAAPRPWSSNIYAVARSVESAVSTSQQQGIDNSRGI